MSLLATPMFIPSPPEAVWHLGPVPIRAYALCVLSGIVVAWIIARTRWKRRGGETETFDDVILVAVITGIIGARIYYVVVDGWPDFFGPDGDWTGIFRMWEGGLGILGGIVFGALGAWFMCHRKQVSFLILADCVAPALPFAQAIGRLGNWFNQEVYGLPTTLPWGLEIDLAHRVAGYAADATFHPTFLYEMIFNLVVGVFLLILSARLGRRLKPGVLFAIYGVCYACGRFLIELVRIDPVPVVFGLRSNSWAIIAVGLVAIVGVVALSRRSGGDDRVVAPVADETAERPVEENIGEESGELAAETSSTTVGGSSESRTDLDDEAADPSRPNTASRDIPEKIGVAAYTEPRDSTDSPTPPGGVG
ncbi:MAG: prolipoprotein diacylglyceryl transferase [Propionibacteriaceae bacterium]|jgi:prolipoprotein diacylglyceryl transferase|nr:prolipoprotein diacylglyceryl transferase [Propionibacteriaceae bacterium]